MTCARIYFVVPLLAGLSALATDAAAQCDPASETLLMPAEAPTTPLFGLSIDIDGDTAVIGAPQALNAGGVQTGAAYVYVRNGGVWTQQAKLTPPAGANGDSFGTSVGISGDRIAVGSPSASAPGFPFAGAVDVFIRSGVTWTHLIRFTATVPQAGANLGQSVAIDGATVAAGAPYRNHNAITNAGGVQVWTHSGLFWLVSNVITAPDAATLDRFGDAIALAGDTILISAPQNDTCAGANAGAAYVFRNSAPLTWTLEARLEVPDATAESGFGYSVALAGAQTAFVGAQNHTTEAGVRSGAVWIWQKLNGLWGFQKRLLPADAGPDLGFGFSLAATTDAVIVGAPFAVIGGIDRGTAYAFTKNNGNWLEQAAILVADAESIAGVGWSVGVSGDTFIAGVPFDTTMAGPDGGSAFVLTLGCDSDSDGVINSLDLCPSTPAYLAVDSSGRPLRDANGDCLVDGADVQIIVNELLGV